MVNLIIGLIVGALSGAVSSYLFLRANAQKKAALDAAVAKVAPKV